MIHLGAPNDIGLLVSDKEDLSAWFHLLGGKRRRISTRTLRVRAHRRRSISQLSIPLLVATSIVKILEITVPLKQKVDVKQKRAQHEEIRLDFIIL